MSAAIYWAFMGMAVVGCCIVLWQVRSAQEECSSRGGVLVSAPLSFGACVAMLGK